jgi:putative transposase
MPHHTLSKGMHFTAGGNEYEILKRLPSGKIQIRNIITNECSGKTEEEIVKALFSGEVELLGDRRNQTFLVELLKKTGASDLTLLSDDDPRRTEVDRRRAYVLEVIRQSPSKLTKETLDPIIEKVGRIQSDIVLGEHKELTKKARSKVKVRPSISTLIRWYNRYIKSGGDERAFISATKSRGNRTRKFSGSLKNNGAVQGLSDLERVERKIQYRENAERVGEIVNKAIDEVYLKEQRFSVQDVYDVVVVKIADENELRTSDNQLPIPHKSSIYDIVDKIDDYEITEKRYGKKIAEEKYKAYKLGPRPTMPLERVEADHTKLDLFVVDPVMMLPIGRPILTWLVCVYTKMILGFYVSFNPYGSLAIMECLKHAIRPKTYVREKYPHIKHTWDTYGVMKKLVVDNAPEFWGRHLEDACRQLGINIQYGQKGRAWYRPTIERTFRTYNTDLLHRQPGTTFSNIIDRADYDPRKNALVTPDILDHATHKYIIDYLHLRPHRGIKDIPALRWEKSIEQWPPSLPAKAGDLDIVLGYLEHRQIHSYGIEIETIIYNDEDLSVLRRRGAPDKKYAIKRNVDDLSLIYVYDEIHDRYLPVRAVDQEYTRGLTLYQHSVIRRYVRERLQRDVDIISLCRAKLEVQEIVERDWNNAKTSRARMARWRNEGIQSRCEGAEPSTDKDWLEQSLNLHRVQSGPLLISPEDVGSSRKGVSDFQSAFNSDGSASEGKDGFIEIAPDLEGRGSIVERSRSKGRGQMKSTGLIAATSLSAQKPGLTNASSYNPVSNPSGDEELDMTGWSADYDMPE